MTLRSPVTEFPLTSERPLRSPVNVRSIALGLTGVCIICGFSAYNNYVINNSFLVGNNFPLGVVLLAFILVALVNGPLNYFMPRWALSGGELTVAFAMTLVSCCLPSAGLMRYWPSSLVSPLWLTQGNYDFSRIFETLHLPRGLFPTFKGSTPEQWARDPLVTGYLDRWMEKDYSPYASWLVPLATWGVFLVALYFAFFCLLSIVHRQWFENERLAFPLATVQSALLEAPSRGRWLNKTLSSRTFAVGFGLTLLLHLWNGMALYLPKYVPAIPVSFNFRSTFTEGPLSYIDDSVKVAVVYLSVVGLTYFLSSQIACGLWMMYLIVNVFVKMSWGMSGLDTDYPARYDQHFGAVAALFVAIIWLGRGHWKLVLRQAVRGPRDGEPRGDFLSYRTAAWGFVANLVAMAVWLVCAGATPATAVVTVGMLMMLMSVITRIVAETGLPYSGLQISLTRPWTMLASATNPHPIPVQSFYLSSMVDAQHYDLREVGFVYLTHAAKAADLNMPKSRREDDLPRNDFLRQRKQLLLAMALAMVVGYIVSAGGMLWTEYHYSTTLDRTAETPINRWGVVDEPRGFIVDAVTRYAAPLPPPVQRSPALHFVIGFAITTGLAMMRMRYAWWPLHPIGFVLLAPPALSRVWFSIFLGWLIKMMVVRIGGSKLYAEARPFFIGVVVGESVAVGVWLVVALIASTKGLPYMPYLVLPG